MATSKNTNTSTSKKSTNSANTGTNVVKANSNTSAETDRDVEALRRDYEDLKKLVGKMQEDARTYGTNRYNDFQESVNETKKKKIDELETRTRAKPLETLAYAFGTGFLVSLFLRR